MPEAARRSRNPKTIMEYVYTVSVSPAPKTLGQPFPSTRGGTYICPAETLWRFLWKSGLAPGSQLLTGGAVSKNINLQSTAGLATPRRLMPSTLFKASELNKIWLLGQCNVYKFGVFITLLFWTREVIKQDLPTRSNYTKQFRRTSPETASDAELKQECRRSPPKKPSPQKRH